MQKKSRLTYFLLLVLLIGEVLHLIIDVGLFYAGDAKAYLVSFGILVIKDILAISVSASMYALLRRQIQENATADAAFWVEPESAFKQGAILMALIIFFIAILGALFSPSNFHTTDHSEAFLPFSNNDIFTKSPQSIYTVFKSHLSFLIVGAYLLLMLIVIERLILFRRQKNTKSNFLLMTVFLLLGSLATIGGKSGDKLNVLSIAFLSVASFMMVLNLMRLSWILPIRRDEKIRAIFLVPSIMGGLVLLFQPLNLDDHFPAYSYSVSVFFYGIGVFVLLYLSFIFFSLLFYLPTSEAFERKSSEVRNLYAMSKFITDVFDEEKIYDSLVGYAHEASGGSSAVWFDMYHPYTEETRMAESLVAAKLPNLQWKDRKDETGFFKTVSLKNVSLEAIQHFSTKASFIWKEISDKKHIVRIDDVENDARFVAVQPTLKNLLRRVKPNRNRENGICSVVAVPLLARNKLIGVLSVAKDVEYGFVKDDLELIATFADQAAIAIDNSRLIRELIDKERLQQELLVAQKIQLRLLPQSQPKMVGYEIDGVSYPAYEVGGDYYDYVQIGVDENKIGIVIADVSGKGTSAAFYMAELKGIVQSLAQIHPNSPKDFLSRANETITRGLEKASFISALYGIVDTAQHTFQLSNAGHCPAVVVQGEKTRLVKMKGLALGLDRGPIFSKHVEEEIISLEPEDIVVLYTDGVIEAVDKHDVQFGYERLQAISLLSRNKCASEIKNDIFNAINHYTNDGGAVRDDLTIVVLKRLRTIPLL